MLSNEFKLTSILLLIFGLGFSLPVCSKSPYKVYGMESAYFHAMIDTTGAICSFYNKESKKEIPFHAKMACGDSSSQVLSVKEYHVSKSGFDSNEGSLRSPFLTIQAAAYIAQPGDVITVHRGIYREHVNPPRGGTSDTNRIIYQAAKGERVEIRGSEAITGWVRFKGNTWKVSIPNSLFGQYNPYKEIISGDWFFPGERDHHPGEVYLNDQSLYEKDSKSGNNVGDPAEKGRVPEGVKLFNEMVDNVINSGWSKELIGSHAVRNNEIFDCGQAGICGSLGAIFSTISNNHIHDIWTKNQFTGFEIGGIKIHAAIDMVIEKNHIHNSYKGIWLDWMAQGTRISNNICYDNMHQDLFLEVNHGPVLLDNNLFLSLYGIRSLSTGVAYVHNLVAGKTSFGPEERATPVFKPHTTEKIMLSNIPGGDDRYFNNIFAGEGLEKYNKAKLPVCINGNVYLNGAKAYMKEMNFVEKGRFNPKIRLEEEDGRLFLHITYDKSIFNLKNKLVTTDLLGKTIITKQYFETTSGSPISIDKDFFGITRKKKNPVAGPFENIKRGVNKLRIW